MFKLQEEDWMMSNNTTSKEAILSICRELISDKGISVLNMRTVAAKCKVALGSIYYYFPSKNDLLIATIESVWEDIFRWDDKNKTDLSFVEYINQLFNHILVGIKKYPNFFTIHSMSFSTKDRNKAHDSMERYLNLIKKNMLIHLDTDEYVNKNAFSDELSKEDFINFVLLNIISLLIRNVQDCKVLLEAIRRIIY